MIKVLKASAGSGKTYNLAREYIRLILQSDKADAYRHVLAVTFTNKATDEMKRRILKELNTLAATPQASPYYRDFVPALFQDAEGLQKRARQQLTGILHDYSAFAVSTIDRFFQQTLRAFSREIGQFSSYQVQLDRDALVTESVDRVLDTLSEQDKTLLAWLTDGVKEELQQSGTFYLDKRLQTVAKSLQDLPAEKAVFPREYLGRLQKVCKGIFKDFETKVSETSEACLKVFEEEGISPAESYSGFFKALYKYRNPSGTVAKPTDSFLRRSRNSALWFSKVKDALRLRLEGLLEEPLGRFLDLFEGPAYKEYVTAKTIFRQLYALGVAQDLRDAFAQIQKEKNVLSIDDSNTILHNIIDGTDAPFIYEKLGVRYEDFLLDEFQDTADIQWENFRPLLYNSESTGNDSLVVGDVKQSIYRWRGSDWNLLGSRLEQEFRGVRPSVLDGNYRTTREIVGFNNAFFAFAAAELDRQGGEDPATPGSISDLYRDVEQKVCFPDPEPGSVEVCFTEDQLGEILDTLQDVRSRVGRWEDVAILVRSNDEGAEVASRLVAENIPVVSDDSLFIKIMLRDFDLHGGQNPGALSFPHRPCGSFPSGYTRFGPFHFRCGNTLYPILYGLSSGLGFHRGQQLVGLSAQLGRCEPQDLLSRNRGQRTRHDHPQGQGTGVSFCDCSFRGKDYALQSLFLLVFSGGGGNGIGGGQRLFPCLAGLVGRRFPFRGRLSEGAETGGH